MKKKILYIGIAAAIISLCGCGNDSDLNRNEEKDIMDFYETAAPIEMSTETPAQKNETRELEYPEVGIYVPQGYENAYLGYRIDLPEDFKLQRRGMFDYELDEDDIIDEANSPTTTDFHHNMIRAGSSKVFEAYSEREYINVVVKMPKESNEYWDEESVLAADAMGKIVEELQSPEDDTTETTQIDVKIEYLDDLFGEMHYAVSYSFQMNNLPFYGMKIFVRSDDRRYLSVFEFLAESADELEQMPGYCSAM